MHPESAGSPCRDIFRKGSAQRTDALHRVWFESLQLNGWEGIAHLLRTQKCEDDGGSEPNYCPASLMLFA
jgi:hypothetical protein